MKIALITEYLEPQVNGIAKRYTEIIENLRDLGNEVDVYGPKNHPNVTYTFPTIKNFWNKHNVFILPGINLFYLFKGNYDIIYITLPFLFWFSVPAIIGKFTGAKIITSNHVNLTAYNESYWKNKTLKNILFYLGKYNQYISQNFISDIIIAPSKFEDTKFFNQDKFHISLNGMNSKKFPFLKKEKINKNIIYVGRIAPEKNLEKLFELFLSLKDYKLIVVGDGPSLQNFKDEYKNNQNIKFEGFIEHKNLWKYFQEADFHLVTSLSETFGMTLIESMACGTPVIYPKCDVFEELYSKEFPELMYDLNDLNSFNNSIDFLNKNISSLSEKSFEFSKNFSWEKITKDLLNLYKDSIT